MKIRNCLDIGALSRFAHRTSEIEERLRVERHVRRCAPCLERLVRLQRYADRLFDDLRRQTEARGFTCPSRMQLEHFRRGSLSERQLVRLQEHLGRCPACRVLGASTAGEAIAALAAPPLPRTCRAHLDVQFAPEGVRILAGADRRRETQPTLAHLLRLPAPAAGAASITSERVLCFVLDRCGYGLDVRIELRSPEGFHLALQVSKHGFAVHAEQLTLWTRNAVLLRREVDEGLWQPGELLPPGHYFLGAGENADPLLALCVEGGLLSAPELAQAGLDSCRRGALHLALRCFEAARPCGRGPVYPAMLARTRRFVRRFALAGRALDLRPRAGFRACTGPLLLGAGRPPLPTAPTLQTPSDLPLAFFAAGHEASVDLWDPAFRRAYASLLRALERDLARLQAPPDPRPAGK